MADEALNELTRARGRLFIYYPFFGSILMKLHLVEADWIPTMATDGVKIFYNPAFVKKLTQEQVCTVMAHEALHVVFGHTLRFGNFIKNSGADDEQKQVLAYKWNMAADYAINPLLLDSGRTEVQGWLCDQKYAGMSAEEIYKLLPDMPTKKMYVFQMGANGKPKNGKGQQDGSGGFGSIKGDKNSPCGGLIPHPASGGTEAEQAEAEAARRSMVADAATLAKQCGKLPGGLSDLIDGMLNPKVDWIDQLRRFLEVIAKNDYSWRTPNRRYTSGGVVLPSLESRETGTFVVMNDTSGSCFDQREQFASEISAMLELLCPEKIIVLHVDAAVNAVEELTPDDLPLKLQYAGGGGTSFRPGFEWLKENEVFPQAIIYLTDAYGDFPTESPDCPTLWVITPDGDKNVNPPFGDVVIMDN